jgi:transcriptional regulator with XRE-family HTH domain
MKRDLPIPVARGLVKLGGDLALARRRRHISQLSMAERIGVSLATLKRLERGDSRVAIAALASTLHILGEFDQLAAILDTARDDIGLMLMDEALPKRIRTRKIKPQTGAL